MRSRSAAFFVVASCLALAAWMGFAWNRARHVSVRALDGASDFQPIMAAPERDAAALATPPLASASAAGLPPQRVDPGGEAELGGTLHVVYDSDGRPASGVDVYWFAGPQLAEGRWRDELDELGTGVEFFRRNGRHFVSDDAGTARVPTDAGLIQVVGIAQSQFGMVTITREAGAAEPIELRLRDAFGVQVQVRHAMSRLPASDVVVVASCSQVPGWRVGARSDEQGIARLFPLFHEENPRGQWYASLPGVFFDEIRVTLPPQERAEPTDLLLPLQERAEPLELLLPDSAPASVRILESNAELCPLSGTLLIGWNDRDGDPVEPRSVRITNGIANLTRLEVGLKLHVRAQFLEVSQTPESVFSLEPNHPAVGRFELKLEKR